MTNFKSVRKGKSRKRKSRKIKPRKRTKRKSRKRTKRTKRKSRRKRGGLGPNDKCPICLDEDNKETRVAVHGEWTKQNGPKDCFLHKSCLRGMQASGLTAAQKKICPVCSNPKNPISIRAIDEVNGRTQSNRLANTIISNAQGPINTLIEELDSLVQEPEGMAASAFNQCLVTAGQMGLNLFTKCVNKISNLENTVYNLELNPVPRISRGLVKMTRPLRARTPLEE